MSLVAKHLLLSSTSLRRSGYDTVRLPKAWALLQQSVPNWDERTGLSGTLPFTIMLAKLVVDYVTVIVLVGILNSLELSSPNQRPPCTEGSSL